MLKIGGLEYDILVLIDTWWNVNTTEARKATPGDAVLIDTWWNVNTSLNLADLLFLPSFNRYMVECELYSVYHIKAAYERF